jgi:signal transduction histidine kinase
MYNTLVDNGPTLVIAVVGAVVLTVLVAVRQILATRENDRLAAELRRAGALDLERERAARQALEAQNQALEEHATLKTEFVATVSHELRTPLTSIVGFVDLLRSDLADSGLTQEIEFVDIIERNGPRLLALVNDLLLLGRLESRTTLLEAVECDAGAIVETAIATAAAEARTQGVELRSAVGTGPALWVDPGRLGQVLDNLVSNAVKFTPAGGTVTVTADRAPAPGRADGPAAAWTIEAADTGCGIRAADQPHVFEKFFRASNAAEQATGTGLGLAISRTIVGLHGGTMTLHSALGVGTTVTVRLPDASAPRGQNGLAEPGPGYPAVNPPSATNSEPVQ